MQIYFKDEKVRDWWHALGSIRRMDMFGRKIEREGAHRLAWTNLREAERDIVRAEFAKAKELVHA